MPSARKYGSIVPRTPLVMTPVTVKPSTSSTSLSLTQMMSSMESTDSHLLAEPFVDFDLSSNCSDALSPIPPFPGGRKRPLIRFASLRSTLLCSPQHILSPGASSELNGCVRTVISTPTPSRLQAILGEVVNVSRWRVRNPHARSCDLILKLYRKAHCLLTRLVTSHGVLWPTSH